MSGTGRYVGLSETVHNAFLDRRRCKGGSPLVDFVVGGGWLGQE